MPSVMLLASLPASILRWGCHVAELEGSSQIAAAPLGGGVGPRNWCGGSHVGH